MNNNKEEPMKNKANAIGLFVLVAVLVAACGTLAEPMAAPTPQPTVMEKPTMAPEAEPTMMPQAEPTAMPEAKPTIAAEETAVPVEPVMEKGTLTLVWNGLEDLGAGYAYEGWLIVDGNPVSSGTFTVDGRGAPSSTIFAVDKDALARATAFVLTIEPVPDTDPAPSAIHVLAGDFEGSTAGLSVGHPAALGDDFADATGVFLLGIPTSNSASDSYRSGIWFTGLNLPTLPQGWIYEGWVVGPDGPLSTGRFSNSRMADSDGAGPTSGPKAGPAFPGQDYLNPPLDLPQGYAAVISIEPDPDNNPAPFALKPLVGTIVDAGDHGNQAMDNNAGAFPTGTASRY
jgi:hypothetical protein